jgi:DNA polymerase-3 subunit delta
MRQIRPPLHFKRRAAVEAQCRRWTASKLAAAVARIRASALAARTASSLEDAHAERLLMELSRLAASRDMSAPRT